MVNTTEQGKLKAESFHFNEPTRKLIHFFGLRRSGNHAVINWLLKNSGGTSIHYNDVYCYLRTPPVIRLPEELAVRTPVRNITVLLSYEDVPLDGISNLPTVKGQNTILENAQVTTVSILRDPFNLFASRLQRLRNLSRENHQDPIQNLPLDKVIPLWKTYAREFVGATNLLGEKITINYNQWFLSKEYRDHILINSLGQQKNDDLGIAEIPAFGGGSSFDPLLYSKDATQMDTLLRWQKFVGDSEYLTFFEDKEIITLSHRIFGKIFGTEQIFIR